MNIQINLPENRGQLLDYWMILLFCSLTNIKYNKYKIYTSWHNIHVLKGKLYSPVMMIVSVYSIF